MRTIRNVTGHNCPACGEDHCVLDPDESNEGHSGSWFCFACESKGTYAITFSQTGDAPSDPVPETPADPAVPGSEVSA